MSASAEWSKQESSAARRQGAALGFASRARKRQEAGRRGQTHPRMGAIRLSIAMDPIPHRRRRSRRPPKTEKPKRSRDITAGNASDRPHHRRRRSPGPPPIVHLYSPKPAAEVAAHPRKNQFFLPSAVMSRRQSSRVACVRLQMVWDNLSCLGTEALARLGLRLGGFQLMFQSSLSDGVAFDPFSFQKDGSASAEVDVGRCQVL